jgi:uncharacterized protein YutE (UPF0331/DUF86 family)
MSLNPDLVRTRCGEIEDSLMCLERIRSLSREAFLADQDTLDIACYRLLVAIEAAIALCYHITANRLRKVPEEYAECFGLLGEAGIIPTELSARLPRMARFRHLLVHMYWKLGYGQVYDVLQTHLTDLRAFRATAAKLV